jgi:hypothetical protein
MSASDDHPSDGADAEAVVDVTLIDEMLRLTPSERLRQNDRMAALAAKLREAFRAKEREWTTGTH